MQIEHIQDGDNRRRMVVDGKTLGWITKWYKSDAVNKTGIKMFSAKPVGLSAVKHDCETYKSAEAYILGYHSEALKVSVSKENVRQRCVDLMRDITMFERNGEYGHPVWHRAQEAFGRALAAYRELGATNAEVIQLGLQRTEQNNG